MFVEGLFKFQKNIFFFYSFLGEDGGICPCFKLSNFFFFWLEKKEDLLGNSKSHLFHVKFINKKNPIVWKSFVFFKKDWEAGCGMQMVSLQ